MRRRETGLTLTELLIVAVILGILTATAVANYLAMQTRAREASTRSNMHTFQMAAEDYGVRNGGRYADLAGTVAALLPGEPSGAGFSNPFDKSTGSGNAWVDRGAWAVPMPTGSTHAGITAYGDSAGLKYQVAGRGRAADFALVLASGR